MPCAAGWPRGSRRATRSPRARIRRGAERLELLCVAEAPVGMDRLVAEAVAEASRVEVATDGF